MRSGTGGGTFLGPLVLLKPALDSIAAGTTGGSWPLISRTIGTSDAAIAPPRRTNGAGLVGVMGSAEVLGVSGMS
jgi:hypothetical protein